MAYFNKNRGIRGSRTASERGIRFRYMISQHAQQRARILTFWHNHGLLATTEAFGVSRRTLYRWQRELREKQGKLDALNKKSTAPKERRKRVVEPWITKRIIELRINHPRLGKEKLHALLAQEGYQGSVSTVGRILADLKERGTLPDPVTYSLYGRTGSLIEKKPRMKRKKKRMPKGYRVLEVDTVARFIDGTKRYILTAVDTETRSAFAAGYTNHGSQSAADFLRKCVSALPDPPPAVQTDNGSEFAKYFDQACDQLNLERFHTHVRSPKENAHVERFNRTLSEEFLIYHRALLRDGVSSFNNKLMDYLLWYNTERPHHALGLVSPFRCMMERLQPKECQKWWTYTMY